MGSLAHSPTPWERFTDRSRVPVRSSRRPPRSSRRRRRSSPRAARGAPPLQLALRQRYDPAGWQAGPAEQAAARKVGLNHRRPPCCYPTLVFSLFSVFGVPERSTRIGTGGVLLGARGKEGGARVRFFQAGNSPIWPAPPGFATSNTGIPSSLK